MNNIKPPQPETPSLSHKPPWWTPRIWLGATLPGWLRLLARNRFAVAWPFWYETTMTTVAAVFNSLLGLLQDLFYARRMARTEITEQPLFILGHWRSGTTLLHEFLALDSRHTFPTNYMCIAPAHFLLTERIARRWFRWVVPKQRAMDNMLLGWDRPQEDEFALCNLGVPSPYRTIAFPNHPPQDQEYLDLRQVSLTDREAWKRAFLKFIKQATLREPKRIVLKSPTHTSRVRTLLELFPDARFVHIVRDPYAIFPSTVHLWKSLYLTQGLQRPNFAGLRDQVFDTFVAMHERLDEDRTLVPQHRFYELRYEDLVADPIGKMAELYDKLALGEFDRLRPRLEAHLAEIGDYQPNRFPPDPALRAEITRRWGRQIREQGYSLEPAPV